MNKLHERVWSCLVPLLVVLTVIGERSISIDRDVSILVLVNHDTSSVLLDEIAADIS